MTDKILPITYWIYSYMVLYRHKLFLNTGHVRFKLVTMEDEKND